MREKKKLMLFKQEEKRTYMCLVAQCVQLYAISWTVTHHAPLFVGFSRQEHWSGLPFPSPGDLPHPGIKVTSLLFLLLAGGLFTTSATWVAGSIHVIESLIIVKGM